jgi:CRP/FNR family transcriptional regulator
MSLAVERIAADGARDCGTCTLRPLCAEPTPRHQRACLIGRRMRLDSGEHLFRAGDAVSGVLCVVIAGHFKLYQHGYNGCQRVIDFPGPGDWLGLDGVGQQLHQAGALALTDCEVAVVPHARLMTLLEQRPRGAEAFSHLLGAELARRQRHGAMLRSAAAAQRVALFLLQRAPPGQEGSIPMLRLDLADYLALTPSTVSRVLATLRRRGWLQLAQRRFTLPVRAAVELLASGTPL